MSLKYSTTHLPPQKLRVKMETTPMGKWMGAEGRKMLNRYTSSYACLMAICSSLEDVSLTPGASISTEQLCAKYAEILTLHSP